MYIFVCAKVAKLVLYYMSLDSGESSWPITSAVRSRINICRMEFFDHACALRYDLMLPISDTIFSVKYL